MTVSFNCTGLYQTDQHCDCKPKPHFHQQSVSGGVGVQSGSFLALLCPLDLVVLNNKQVTSEARVWDNISKYSF